MEDGMEERRTVQEEEEEEEVKTVQRRQHHHRSRRWWPAQGHPLPTSRTEEENYSSYFSLLPFLSFDSLLQLWSSLAPSFFCFSPFLSFPLSFRAFAFLRLAEPRTVLSLSFSFAFSLSIFLFSFSVYLWICLKNSLKNLFNKLFFPSFFLDQSLFSRLRSSGCKVRTLIIHLEWFYDKINNYKITICEIELPRFWGMKNLEISEKEFCERICISYLKKIFYSDFARALLDGVSDV